MGAYPDGTVAAVSRNETYSFSKPQRDEILLLTGLGVEGDAHAGITVRHRSRVAADPTQPNLRQVHLIHDELFDELRADGFGVVPGQLGENVTTRDVDLLGLPRGTILRFGTVPEPTTRVVAESTGTAAADLDTSGADPIAAVAAAAERLGLTCPVLDTSAAQSIAAVVATAARATLKDPARNAVAALIEAAGRAGPALGTTVVVLGLRNPCQQINNFRPGLLNRVVGRDQHGDLIRKGGVMAVVLRGGPIRPGDPVVAEPPAPPYLPLEPV